MLIVGYTLAPHVAYVHIRVPHFARRSKEALLRWAAKAPGETQLDLTTMRAYGKLQVSRLPLKDLRHTSSWVSVANLARVPSAPSDIAAKRRWWMLKPMKEFYVAPEQPQKRQDSVWQLILKRIPKESADPTS